MLPTSIQDPSSFGLMDWYQIQHTKCSLQFVTIQDMWVNIIEARFRLFVPRWWVKSAEKLVNLLTSMMSHLMFVYHLCSPNPKSSVPRWIPLITTWKLGIHFHISGITGICVLIDLTRLFMQQVTESIDVCVEDETVNYLNRLDVQKALHARLVGVRKWAVCSKYFSSPI